MTPIPKIIREEMSSDPFYSRCCVTGTAASEKKVEWHHAFIFAGKQVQEKWCILPILKEIHARAENKSIKPILHWIMLNRANEEELQKYSKVVPLVRRREALNKRFGVWHPGKYFQLTPAGNIAVPRTLQQNRALHLFFEMLATSLNDAGLDQRKVLKPSVSIPWTKMSIKDQLWRPIQQVMFNKRSTTELLKQSEIDQIHETLTRHLAEKFGVEYIPFPSYEKGYIETAPLKSDSPKYRKDIHSY